MEISEAANEKEQRLPAAGIVGVDHASRIIVPLLRRHVLREGFEVTALWGETLETASKMAAALNIGFVTSRIDEVLLCKYVDLVVILTPPVHHAQITVKALGIGKHVCVLSPSGLTSEETLRMVQAAHYYPRLLALPLLGLRLLRPFVLLRDAVTAGRVGESNVCIDLSVESRPLNNVDNFFSWTNDHNLGGGAVSLLGTPCIDLVSFVLNGAKATRVFAQLKTVRTGPPNGIRRVCSDDLSTVHLHMSNGVDVRMNLNCCRDKFKHEIAVCGPKATLVVTNGRTQLDQDVDADDEDDDDDRLKHPDPMWPALFRRALEASIAAARKRLLHLDDNNEDDHDNPKLKSYEEETSTLPTFEDALYVNAVIEALRRSSEERCWIKVATPTHRNVS